MDTERLIIRKFKKEDYQDLYEYLSKAEVVKFEPYYEFSLEECIEEAIERSKENSPFFAVVLKSENKLIGHIYFNQIEDPDWNTYSLGYVFNPKYYHKGFATEGCMAILDYAFTVLKAHRVCANVNQQNEASWRLLERLSMRREGEHKQNVFFKRDKLGMPIWHDSYSYAILCTEYRKK